MRAPRQPRGWHLALATAVLALVLAACAGADQAPDGELGEADPGASAEAPDDPADVPDEEPTDPPAREEEDPELSVDAADPGGEDTEATVPALLDFTAPAVGGGEVRGADHVGLPVALWFWAPW